MDEAMCDNLNDLSSVDNNSFLSRITIRSKPVSKSSKNKQVLGNIQEFPQNESNFLKKSKPHRKNNTSVSTLSKFNNQSRDNMSVSYSEPHQMKTSSPSISNKLDHDVESFKNESCSTEHEVLYKKSGTFNVDDTKNHKRKTKKKHKSKYNNAEDEKLSIIVQDEQFIPVNDHTFEGMEVFNDSSTKSEKNPKSSNKFLSRSFNEKSTTDISEKEKRRNSIAICDISQIKDGDSALNFKMISSFIKHKKKHKMKHKNYPDNSQTESHLKDNFDDGNKVEDSQSKYFSTTAKLKKKHKLNHKCLEASQTVCLHSESSLEGRDLATAESTCAFPTVKQQNKYRKRHTGLGGYETDPHFKDDFKQIKKIESNENKNYTSTTITKTKRKLKHDLYVEKDSLEEKVENNTFAENKFDFSNTINENIKKIELKHSEDLQRGFTCVDGLEKKEKNEVTAMNKCDSPIVKHTKKRKHSEDLQSGNLTCEDNLEGKDKNEASAENKHDSSTLKHKKKRKHLKDLQSGDLSCDNNLEGIEKIEATAMNKYDSPIVKHKKKHKLKRKHSEDSLSEGLCCDDYLKGKEKTEDTENNKYAFSTFIDMKHSEPKDAISSQSPSLSKEKKSLEILLPSVMSQTTQQMFTGNKKVGEKAHDLGELKHLPVVPKKTHNTHKSFEKEPEIKGPNNLISSTSLMFENMLKKEREMLYSKNLSISKKNVKSKKQKGSKFIKDLNIETSNKLQPKNISENIFPDKNNVKKTHKRNKIKHTTSTSKNKLKKKLLKSLAYNEIDIMQNMLIKKALDNATNQKKDLSKTSMGCSTKFKENKHKELSSVTEKTKLLDKSKQIKHLKDKNKMKHIQIKDNKMDIQHIQQSLLNKAFKDLNSKPGKVKSSIKSKIESRNENCLKIRQLEHNKGKEIIVQDKKDKTPGTKKRKTSKTKDKFKKKKSKTKDELEDITSKLISTAIASKRLTSCS